jgi:hypothetical protein
LHNWTHTNFSLRRISSGLEHGYGRHWQFTFVTNEVCVSPSQPVNYIHVMLIPSSVHEFLKYDKLKISFRTAVRHFIPMKIEFQEVSATSFLENIKWHVTVVIWFTSLF